MVRLADTFKMGYFVFRLLSVCISLLFSFLIYIQNLEAAEWYIPDDLNIQTFYGKTNWTTFGHDPEDDYTWANISFGAEKRLFSWLEIIGSLGLGYIEADNHGSTPSVEMRLVGQAQYGYFYFDLGGGFAYLFDRDNLPELANSKIYGLIKASLGVEIFRLDDAYHNLYCKAGYRIEHLSSPFDGSNDDDHGVNVGA